MHALTLTFTDAVPIRLLTKSDLGGKRRGTFEPPFDDVTLVHLNHPLMRHALGAFRALLYLIPRNLIG